MADFECLVIGGGVIGRWIALELADRRLRVGLVDWLGVSTQASWASAGILPPPASRSPRPEDRLATLSWQLYPEWVERLQRETGIDIQMRRCGAIHLTRRLGEAAALAAAAGQWAADGIAVERLSVDHLREREPNLHVTSDPPVRCAYRLPDECQLRPPRLLQALYVSLERRGVWLAESTRVLSISPGSDRVCITTPQGSIRAQYVCVAAGAWSAHLLRPLGIDLGVEPFRGQILAWACDRAPVRHVINEGPRYLVAREDGILLAGSTVEDVGFDDRTTPEALAELEAFAVGWLPLLANLRPVRSWAGLRPGSREGRPYLGPVPGHANIIVASGHFRSGISLAPGTARVMGQLITGEPPGVPLEAFGLTASAAAPSPRG